MGGNPVLLKFLDYSLGSGTDHIECCEKPIICAAREALTGLTAKDFGLMYDVDHTSVKKHMVELPTS